MAAASQRPPGVSSRRVWGLVALARGRLRRRASGILAGLVAAGFIAVAVAFRVLDGEDAPLAGMVATAARWLAWIAGGPVALAAAEDRHAFDRRDGIEALAASRGFSDRSQESARVLGAMFEVALAIGLPLAAVAGVCAAMAGSAPLALRRVGLLLGAVLFAIIAGVALGGVAAACGRLGRARGRWLFAAVILVPWVIADLAGHAAWSIPGALDAAIEFVVRGGSGGS